jgi:hypothetical protein
VRRIGGGKAFPPPILQANEKLVVDAKARLAGVEATLASMKAATATKVEGTLQSNDAEKPVAC